MNRQYMDFVPKQMAKRSDNVKKTIGVTHVKPAAGPAVSDFVKPRAAYAAATRTTASAAVTTGARPVVKSVKEDELGVVEDVKMKLPQPTFVNTEKVVKRPLSKNVYPRKAVAPVKEKSYKPVTIIEKPNKDSRAGMIVAIIITIILGAAAGTVAFLLLPK